MQMSGKTSGLEGLTCGIAELLNPQFFKAMCDPNRINLVVLLAQSPSPQTVSQIAVSCSVDLSVVSRHLATLRDAGILKAERRGKEVYYSVPIPQLVQTLRAMAEALEHCCPEEVRKAEAEPPSRAAAADAS